MKPPALPIAPKDYNADYINGLTRILTQYLNHQEIEKTSLPSVGYTVATLPNGTIGHRAYVTDATAPTYLGALTGGGAVVCPVFHNGTAWVSA